LYLQQARCHQLTRSLVEGRCKQEKWWLSQCWCIFLHYNIAFIHHEGRSKYKRKKEKNENTITQTQNTHLLFISILALISRHYCVACF